MQRPPVAMVTSQSRLAYNGDHSTKQQGAALRANSQRSQSSTGGEPLRATPVVLRQRSTPFQHMVCVERCSQTSSPMAAPRQRSFAAEVLPPPRERVASSRAHSASPLRSQPAGSERVACSSPRLRPTSSMTFSSPEDTHPPAASLQPEDTHPPPGEATSLRAVCLLPRAEESEQFVNTLCAAFSKEGEGVGELSSIDTSVDGKRVQFLLQQLGPVDALEDIQRQSRDKPSLAVLASECGTSMVSHGQCRIPVVHCLPKIEDSVFAAATAVIYVMKPFESAQDAERQLGPILIVEAWYQANHSLLDPHRFVVALETQVGAQHCVGPGGDGGTRTSPTENASALGPFGACVEDKLVQQGVVLQVVSLEQQNVHEHQWLVQHLAETMCKADCLPRNGALQPEDDAASFASADTGSLRQLMETALPLGLSGHQVDAIGNGHIADACPAAFRTSEAMTLTRVSPAAGLTVADSSTIGDLETVKFGDPGPIETATSQAIQQRKMPRKIVRLPPRTTMPLRGLGEGGLVHPEWVGSLLGGVGREAATVAQATPAPHEFAREAANTAVAAAAAAAAAPPVALIESPPSQSCLTTSSSEPATALSVRGVYSLPLLVSNELDSLIAARCGRKGYEDVLEYHAGESELDEHDFPEQTLPRLKQALKRKELYVEGSQNPRRERFERTASVQVDAGRKSSSRQESKQRPLSIIKVGDSHFWRPLMRMASNRADMIWKPGVELVVVTADHYGTPLFCPDGDLGAGLVNLETVFETSGSARLRPRYWQCIEELQESTDSCGSIAAAGALANATAEIRATLEAARIWSAMAEKFKRHPRRELQLPTHIEGEQEEDDEEE